MRFWKLAALVAAMTAVLFAGRAAADDTVVLNDGTTVTGEIVRELDGNVWLLEKIGSIEIERFYSKGQISEIVRDAPAASDRDADRDTGREGRESASKPRSSGSRVPKGAVISLEGTVGIQMTAKKLEELIPTLEDELGTDGTGIVVFKINSGGGMAIEVPRLNEVIQEEYKPRFRVVSWIESAISAAAMTSHVIEEIYFMPRGNYGACTAFNPAQFRAAAGRSLETYLYQMEQVSALGGYDHRIMRAMQIDVPLRASIDDRTGQVTWFESTDAGEHLINPAGEILTFNSETARKFQFSKGTASTLDELTDLLQLTEVEWVGRWTPERIYPISRAESEMIRFREDVTEDDNRFREYANNYQIAVNAARGANDEVRGALVGRAKRELRKIERMQRRNPNMGLSNLNLFEDEFDDWLAEQEEMLRELLQGP